MPVALSTPGAKRAPTAGDLTKKAQRAVDEKLVQRVFFPRARLVGIPDAIVRDATASEVAASGGTDGDESGPLEAVINTADVDRYRTIVDPKGAVFDNFLKNPILQWAHGMDFSIGTWPVETARSMSGCLMSDWFACTLMSIWPAVAFFTSSMNCLMLTVWKLPSG